MPKKYKKIPPFNPHASCPGHSVSHLDCEFTEQSERDLMIRILDNYIEPELSTA